MRSERCPVPHCGGRLVVDEEDARQLCDLAGHIAADPEPGMGEKLLSNATPEHEQNSGPRETPALAALIARALTIPAAHPKEDDHE
jgi:hypothetical protein